MQRWHGFHVFDKLQAKVSIGFGQGSYGKGDQYWVDGFNGSATASGLSPDEPLDTIEGAIAKCSSDNDDYIWVMQGYQEGETINVDKSLVHIIAYGSPFATFMAQNVATDIHVWRVESTGNHAEITGFAIGGGSTKAGIFLADSYSVWIHHNSFGHAYAGDTPLYGIQAWNSGNPANCLIEYNIFFGDGKSDGKITSNGIYVEQAGSNSFSNSIIRNNTFLGLIGASDAGAIVTDQVRGLQIIDNLFHNTDAADGDAINLLSVSQHCLIEGNRTSHGMLAAGNTYNPYRDLNTNTLNGWGNNTLNGVLIEPVGV